jgi:hypothetical protein
MMNKMFLRFSVLSLGFLWPYAFAGDLTWYVPPDRYRFCAIAGYEDILETACSWDATARAAGNCDQPQYQQAVGKRTIYQACSTLLVIGEGGPLPASPPPTISAADAKIWRLIKSLQPIAAVAVANKAPACLSNVKPYPERRAKADHEFYFRCINELDSTMRKNAKEGLEGRIVAMIEEALARSNFNDPLTVAAAAELALLLEDEGVKASMSSIDALLQRFK